VTPFELDAADLTDVVAAQAGDDEAFGRLIHRHEYELLGRLRRFTTDEAMLQDLRQETYLEAFKSISTYRREGPFSHWLRCIAMRVGYRYWAGQAKEARAKNAYLELRRYCVPTISTGSAQDDADSVRELLARLSEGDRTLLIMRYALGHKATEIAEDLGWDATRVRVRLHRAVKKLRSMDTQQHAADTDGGETSRMQSDES
jgi:RNA polymerase sigma-70 factor (ECF subfamily)